MYLTYSLATNCEHVGDGPIQRVRLSRDFTECQILPQSRGTDKAGKGLGPREQLLRTFLLLPTCTIFLRSREFSK